MPSYSSLTPSQKIQYAKDVSMANNGVTQPNTTAINTVNLDKLITSTSVDINAIKQLLGNLKLTSGASPYTYPVPFSSLPGEVQSKLKQFIPPGYTPPTTITGQEIIDIEQGVLNSLQELKANPASLPKAGAGSTPTVQPAPSSSTISNILTAAAVIGGGALVVNALNNRVQNATPDALPETPATEYPPLPVTPGPLPDWYVNPNATGPNTPEVVPEVVQNATPVNVNELTPVDPNVNVNFGTDPNPGIVTPGTGPDPVANVNIMGLQGPTNVTRAQKNIQDTENANTQGDWRVRLSLAPNSTYLYNATDAGILKYLKNTRGVVFPYLPQIQVTYAANYESSDIVHSNYKMIQYKNSAVDIVTITGDFTAQDTYEANYLLAVIHFFRSVTKMFYGKDQIPKPGTPPPLCYLSGLGDFQFDRHPLVISTFNYSLPNDVDYIRAGSPTLLPGVDSTAYNAKGGEMSPSESRLQVGPNAPNVGAIQSDPKWRNGNTNAQPTYVPTKMTISITAYPIVTRNDISNNFSLKDYATGALLQGNKNKSGGGIW